MTLDKRINMNIIKKVNFNMHLKLILRPLIEWMDENSIDEIQSLSKKVNETLNIFYSVLIYCYPFFVDCRKFMI